MYMQLILVFKVMHLNAQGWSARPKHVAYIDETNKTLSWSMAVRRTILTSEVWQPGQRIQKSFENKETDNRKKIFAVNIYNERYNPDK
jgi:hypothetical protein